MYINTVDLEYPVSEQEIKSRFPNVSFPEKFVAPEPYAFVVATIQPKFDRATQGVREASPKLISGKWTQVWEVYGLSQEQIDTIRSQQWKTIQIDRNERLQSCDWTQLPDVPLTEEQKQAWVAYRQDLRDVTNQPDPFNIVWPVAPQT